MLYLWKLYCLPGRVIAWLEYFFPGRGQVWASGRRKDNEIVHFLFSTFVYGLLGYLAWQHVQKPARPPVAAPLLATEAPTAPNPEQIQRGLSSPAEAGSATEEAVDASAPQGETAAEVNPYWLTVDERKCEQAATAAVTNVRCPTDRMRQAGWTDERWAVRVHEIICDMGTDYEKQAAGCPSAADKLAAAREITNPAWLRRPSAEDVARYYPERAMEAGVGGRATLACQVTAEGRLAGCSVDSEEPHDQGFGEAALRMSKLFRMRPMTADGQPVNGTTVRIPIRFSVGAGF